MIGIVSINKDRNYGAVLQAVGLQSFLKKIGIESRFINIETNYDQVLYLTYSSSKEIIKSLFTLLHYKKLKEGCKRFQSFIEQYEKCYDTYSDYDELKKSPPIVDGYVVGSDQVWIAGNLFPIYSLEFAQKKAIKISYAASMGTDRIDENERGIYEEYFKYFDCISVREKSAIDAIKKTYCGIVDYHVDPALLHDSVFWSKFETRYQGKIPQKYILLYLIYVPLDINEKLRGIKKKTNFPIVMVSNTSFKNVYCDYYIRDAGPAEFLWLVNHSEGVISSSYHGVVYSIIYHKPFIALNNPIKPTRIENLLALLHLEEFDKWDEEFLEKDMLNYDYDSILSFERQRSKKYLEAAFSVCQ